MSVTREEVQAVREEVAEALFNPSSPLPYDTAGVLSNTLALLDLLAYGVDGELLPPEERSTE